MTGEPGAGEGPVRGGGAAAFNPQQELGPPHMERGNPMDHATPLSPEMMAPGGEAQQEQLMKMLMEMAQKEQQAKRQQGAPETHGSAGPHGDNAHGHEPAHPKVEPKPLSGTDLPFTSPTPPSIPKKAPVKPVDWLTKAANKVVDFVHNVVSLQFITGKPQRS